MARSAGACRCGGLLCALLLAPCACEKKPSPQPPSSPSSQPITRPHASPQPQPAAAPEIDPILPESHQWTHEQAVPKLADEEARLSAAVRLVRLSGAAAGCVPAKLTPAAARRLRVVKLSETFWGLGSISAGDDARLGLPVLITVEGVVTQPAEGGEQEAAWLHVSDKPHVFPHLIVTPQRVLIVGDQVLTAMVLKSGPPAGFAWRRRPDGYRYVALMLAGDAARSGPAAETRGELLPGEVARYRWDAIEAAFIGPGMDKLPDPPGGTFELDLKESEALQPVGGDLPEPPPLPPPPRPRQPDEPPGEPA